jgi:hypothetical protein
VGFENGAWLQVRRISELTDEQRERLRATPGAAVAINLVRPTESGELPMRRIFEDQQGNELAQFDLWKYGYDARSRPWYRDTRASNRLLISSPYLAFSIGAPVITISTPVRGKVPGVLAADLKLDTFSAFVQTQKPGEHGIVWIFDTVGSLLAHPDFPQFVTDTMTHPSRSHLPDIDDIRSGVAKAVLTSWRGGDPYDGEISDDAGRDYLFRLAQFNLGRQYYVSILLAEAADPDVLMRQTSRYFSALTESFLAEEGTVDKFIGDFGPVIGVGHAGAGGHHIQQRHDAAHFALQASEHFRTGRIHVGRRRLTRGQVKRADLNCNEERRQGKNERHHRKGDRGPKCKFPARAHSRSVRRAAVDSPLARTIQHDLRCARRVFGRSQQLAQQNTAGPGGQSRFQVE